MYLHEKITFKNKHREIFIQYIEKCLKEIIFNNVCRTKNGSTNYSIKYICTRSCCIKAKSFLKNSTDRHSKKSMLYEISNSINNEKITRENSKLEEMPLILDNSDQKFESHLNSLIFSIYKICVSARVSFYLLSCTIIVLRMFEANDFSRGNNTSKNNFINLKLYGIKNPKKHNNSENAYNKEGLLTTAPILPDSLLNSSMLIKFITALIVTQKYYNDYSYSMSDYHDLLLRVGGKSTSSIKLDDLNSFERIFLSRLGHELKLDEIKVEKECRGFFLDYDIQEKKSLINWIFYLFGCK